VLAIHVDDAVRASLQDDWRKNPTKTRMVLRAIKGVIGDDEVRVAEVFAVVQAQNEY
jgi:hypothetical protein